MSRDEETRTKLAEMGVELGTVTLGQEGGDPVPPPPPPPPPPPTPPEVPTGWHR